MLNVEYALANGSIVSDIEVEHRISCDFPNSGQFPLLDFLISLLDSECNNPLYL